MTTFHDILKATKDRILTGLPLFTSGYEYARIDISKGLVVTVGKEGKYVAVNDTEGNYFYIRVPEKITALPAKAMADSNVAITQRYPCSLVAVCKEVDEFLLADALCNELLKTKKINVTAVLVDPATIIEAEFKGLKKNVLEAAKARLGDMVLVRIDFDMVRIFETNNCIYDLCKTC